MKKTFFVTLLLAGAASSIALAKSDCGLDLQANNVTILWNPELATQQLMFSVSRSENKECHYAVTFSKGRSSTYDRKMSNGSAILDYQLYKDISLANILKDVPDANGIDDVIAGSFDRHDQKTQLQTYYLKIPTGAATAPKLKPAGIYTDTYLLRLYDDINNRNSSNPDDIASVQLVTIIPKRIAISLVNTGAVFNEKSTSQMLDFGTLVEGATRSFDLRVQSNSGYSIGFSSQNNGSLKHWSSSVTTTIPYTLKVNSTAQNLATSQANPIVVTSGNGQTTLEGVANTVSVTIGSVSGKMAGNYSDYITVTATTTE